MVLELLAQLRGTVEEAALLKKQAHDAKAGPSVAPAKPAAAAATAAAGAIPKAGLRKLREDVFMDWYVRYLYGDQGDDDDGIIGVIIHVDGSTEVVAMPEHDALPKMQEIVGGYIEGVTIDGGRMYVNEEGLLRGLPVNPKACTFYPGPTPIVGDVIILGPIVRDGWDSSITPELIERIASLWA